MGKEDFKMLFTFVLVILISTSVIAVTHFFTRPIIEENAIIRENNIIAEIFPNSSVQKIETTFSSEEAGAGLNEVFKVENNYIYRASVVGLFAGEKSTFIVVIDSLGNFSNFQIIESEDDYINNINNPQFKDRFLGQSHDVEFDGINMPTQATLSATPFVEAIMAAGRHFEREFLK